MYLLAFEQGQVQRIVVVGGMHDSMHDGESVSSTSQHRRSSVSSETELWDSVSDIHDAIAQWTG